jgi:hypothetical protein
MPRRFPIFQLPNRPLIVAMLAGGLAGVTEGRAHDAAAALWRLALLVWSGEEVASGANWFRRLLGIGGAWTAISASVPGRASAAAVARRRG